MTNVNIVKIHLTYEILNVEHVCNLGPSAPLAGKYFKNVTTRRIVFSFVSMNNYQNIFAI